MRRNKLAAFGAVAALGLVAFFVAPRDRRPPEPTYQGKTVTEWLDAMAYATGGFQPGEPRDDPAFTAIRHIGAAAVPVCIRHLQTGREPSKFQRRWMMARASLRGLFSGSRNVQVWPPAWPDREVKRWTCASAALIWLGPEQQAGVPRLIDAVSVSPFARAAAANAFFLVGTNQPSALPALISGLGDSRLMVRQFCAEAISRMSPWAATALPALTNLVHDPDRTVRTYAIGTLGAAGKGNAGVSGLLRDAMSRSTDADTRAVIGRALNDLNVAAQPTR